MPHMKRRMVPEMMAKKGMEKSMYKKGGSNMTGLKAMFKSLSDSQKQQLMEAKYGKEKLLMKMGGMLDMAKPMEMKYGGSSMPKDVTQMRYGGATTYSGPKKRKKGRKK